MGSSRVQHISDETLRRRRRTYQERLSEIDRIDRELERRHGAIRIGPASVNTSGGGTPVVKEKDNVNVDLSRDMMDKVDLHRVGRVEFHLELTRPLPVGVAAAVDDISTAMDHIVQIVNEDLDAEAEDEESSEEE